MKKVLWMLVAVAMLGFGASAIAKDKAGGEKHGKPVMVSGTVKVDGDKVCIVADDGSYVVKSHNEKAIEALKAKDGQKVELKGWVKDEHGMKMLMIAGGKGEHGKKKEAAGEQK